MLRRVVLFLPAALCYPIVEECGENYAHR